MRLRDSYLTPQPTFHVTNILLALNVVMFLGMILVSKGMQTYIFETFAFSMKNFAAGAIWSPATSMFLHGNLAHLVLNMTSLFFFGRALESEVSKKKYLAIYFTGGIISGILSGLLRSPEQLAVGASGAIFAIIAAAMIIKPFDFVAFPYVLPVPILFVATIMIISNLILFVNPPDGSNISFSAHIVGFAVGLIFGIRSKGWKRAILIISVAILTFLLASQYMQALNILNYTSVLQKLVS